MRSQRALVVFLFLKKKALETGKPCCNFKKQHEKDAMQQGSCGRIFFIRGKGMGKKGGPLETGTAERRGRKRERQAEKQREMGGGKDPFKREGSEHVHMVQLRAHTVRAPRILNTNTSYMLTQD